MKSLIVALLLVVSATPAFAQSTLSYNEVRGMAGDYIFDIIKNRKVSSLLRSNLGEQTYNNLIARTATSSPSEFIDGRFLVVSGCVPHNCGGNESFFVIDAQTPGALLVLFQTENRNRIFRNQLWKDNVEEFAYRSLTQRLPKP